MSSWSAGIGHSDDTPPPPAPTAGVPGAALSALFQTLSTGGGPIALRVVPPTPVTSGWLAGSSTAAVSSRPAALVAQSSDPSSPPAATNVWPSTEACSKSSFSARAEATPSWASHSPHETVTTWARSWLTIALKMS